VIREADERGHLMNSATGAHANKARRAIEAFFGIKRLVLTDKCEIDGNDVEGFLYCDSWPADRIGAINERSRDISATKAILTGDGVVRTRNGDYWSRRDDVIRVPATIMGRKVESALVHSEGCEAALSLH